MPNLLRRNHFQLTALLLAFCVIFTREFSHAQGEWLPSSIAVTTDGNVIALVTTYDVYGLIKLDQTGNILWRKRHGVRDESDFMAVSMAPFDDGGFIVLGNHRYNHPVFRVYDRDGNQLLEFSFSLDTPSFLHTLFRLSDGNYLVGGGDLYARASDGQTGTGLLVKFGATGNVLWRQQYQYEKDTSILSIGELEGGEIALAMNYGEMSKFGPVEGVVRIAVCDSSGKVLRSTDVTKAFIMYSGAMKTKHKTIYLSYVESAESKLSEKELAEADMVELSEEEEQKLFSMMFQFSTRVKSFDSDSLKKNWKSKSRIFNSVFNPVVSLWPDSKVVVFGGEFGNSLADVYDGKGRIVRTVPASTDIPLLNTVNVGDCDASDKAAYALGSSTALEPPDFGFNPGVFVYKVTPDNEKPEWFKIIDKEFPPEPE